MGDVNPRRTYTSSLRDSQAEVTRHAVLDAARALFITQGYGSTTLDQIAARAGVSKPTVFSAVGNKQTLLKVVRDIAIAGDDKPIPVSRRPMTERIRTEADRGRAVGLLARHLTNVADRYAAVYETLRAAAANGEEELKRLWETEEQQRLTGARFWVGVLQAKGDPPPQPFDVDTAVDALWLYMAPDHYTRLVQQRGWSRHKYQRWLAAQIARLFGPSTKNS
jgi:AcrR family transcriptional regulator